MVCPVMLTSDRGLTVDRSCTVLYEFVYGFWHLGVDLESVGPQGRTITPSGWVPVVLARQLAQKQCVRGMGGTRDFSLLQFVD